MKTQTQCPKCGSFKLKVTDRNYYLRVFIITAVLAVGCYVTMKILAPGVLTMLGLLIFSLFAFASLIMMAFKSNPTAICKTCGFKFNPNNASINN